MMREGEVFKCGKFMGGEVFGCGTGWKKPMLCGRIGVGENPEPLYYSTGSRRVYQSFFLSFLIH